MNLFKKKKLVTASIALLALGLIIFSFTYFPSAQMVVAEDFGVVSFISSLPQNSDKQAMIAKIKKAGFGWVREEYTYTLPMNYFPFDQAYKRIVPAGLNILGLLTYPGPEQSHEVWKKYVTETVDRYPAVSAWEIMNEADNYLSAADYTVYLKEASEIIRAKSNKRIICTGITARVGDNQFWDGIAEAGGWDAFDGIGLHIYHFGDPYQDTNDNGTFAQEIQKTIDSANKNGGGKTIWVTEFGYDTNDYSQADQAKWLVESLSIMKAMPEVERGFVFRLYEHDNGLGLLDKDYSEKESFNALKNWLAAGAPATTASLTPPPETFDAAPPEALVDETKSEVRVDGANISPDGQEQFRVVVAVKDTEGKIITDKKPQLEVNDTKTVPTDFTLVGDEWFAYVASNDSGEKTAQVKVADKQLTPVQMVFGVTDTKAASEITPVVATPSNSTNIGLSQPAGNISTDSTTFPLDNANNSTIAPELVEQSKTGLIWFIIIESIISLFIILISLILWKRTRP